MSNTSKNAVSARPIFNFRLTHAERGVWVAAAQAAGISAQEFGRRAIIDQAFKALARKRRPTPERDSKVA